MIANAFRCVAEALGMNRRARSRMRKLGVNRPLPAGRTH